jgi:hypothetical protein
LGHHSHPGIVRRRHKRQYWGPLGSTYQNLISLNPRKQLKSRINFMLRRHQPIVLQTPRWSAPDIFLRELFSNNKSFLFPHIHITPQYTLSEVWMLVAQSFQEALDLEEEEVTALLFIAERKGFRWYLHRFFDLLSKREHTYDAIIIEAVENLPLSIVEDIQLAWIEYFSEITDELRIPIVIAGAIEGGLFHNILWLSDYGDEESKRLFLSAGLENHQEIEFCGGVPAFVHALLSDPTLDSWNRLKGDARKLIELISVQSQYYDRLIELSQSEHLIAKPELDIGLMQAGLVIMTGKGSGGICKLRSPIFNNILKNY